MPRRRLIRSNCLPYHVTARANNRDEFHLPLPHFWEILTKECLNLAIVYGVEFHALVLMPNHFHMVLTTPEDDLGKVMNILMSFVTRTANLNSGRTGHTFGGPYYWSLIRSSRYFGHALKYVYRNPVRANLCDRVENYPFSTLRGLLGLSHLPFPLHLTRVGMEVALPSLEPWSQLEWLNTPFPQEAEELIKKGLQKRVFDQIIDPSTRAPSGALTQFL